ncbi:two-component response regulator (plasmid) [Legionella adelaidensis]|uniref:Two-component response regulator n=1 Tax=Legionella adelaidensis TaxID=45056 RepID=A0A0W0R567_9GAMM|nr:response regulator [Legionella adelaidensis]KTC66241.1 two-component response regulator [Legionella adelaidensis]VEH85756.1 two-component response regulator [Legionella adelaidensis]
MHSFDSSIPIMLIEDDDVDIQDVKRTFQKINITNPLYIATNGDEALDKLYGRNGEIKLHPAPKIILLDINMPRMNGIEFLKILRSDPELRSILVFVLTSSNNDKDKVAAYNLNVAGYILKPLKFSEFIDSISSLYVYWSLLEFPQEKKW